MNRTRLIFFVAIAVALVIVAIGLVARSASPANNPIAPAQSSEPIEVRVVTALPIEPWITAAANQYNAENHTLDGRAVKVTVVPMAGLRRSTVLTAPRLKRRPRPGSPIRVTWWSWPMPLTRNAMAVMCS
jgi:uncharacterized membrane protein